MGIFHRKEDTRRSIEDIFTPKGEGESEEVAETSEEVTEEKSENTDIVIGKEFVENALDCFGWEEAKTEKWMIKSAKIWYAIMSFVWFLFGALTFAPIIFIKNKINVIFKNEKKSLFVATMIYCGIIALIIIISIMRKHPILDE